MVSYLTGINGITTLYPDAPWEMLGDNWQNPATGLQGTPAFLHINNSSETRVTIPAVLGGQKAVTYDVSLVLLYQYWIPADAPTKSAWVDGLDTLIDSVVDRIRADPAFGTGPQGTIWQAGEEQHDIAVHSDLPHTMDGGLVMAWNRIDFRVREIVVA
jgi:hypothetical protein